MNLFWFLTSIIQYKLSWDKRASVDKIKKMVMESGPVWQKFAQTLAGQEDLIGRELAIELQDILYDCPKHPDNYSRKAIRQDFGDKYDLTDMELIGSGTIAQVYRVGNICIKIRHPNIATEVMDAVSTYKSICDAIPFMPATLKQFCDNFFEGIGEQVDFHKEYKNGLLFKKLFHDKTRPDHNLYVIPRMLDKTDECLVMEYEHSCPLVLRGRNAFNKKVMIKALHGILLSTYIGLLHGIIHADLHFGNYGVRGDIDSMQIVIYDFGHIYDVRDLSFAARKQIVKSFELLDSTLLFNSMVDDEYHRNNILNGRCVKNGYKPSFDANTKYMIMYITIHGVPVDKSKFKCIMVGEKSVASSNLLLELENDTDCMYFKRAMNQSHSTYYNAYYPYDDVKTLRDFAVKFD
jgi:predicted unusual protein kinase regulating ubiquinone biosynthesis (AarF/ABC1/UbiB family)